jgi:hypothetical protein
MPISFLSKVLIFCRNSSRPQRWAKKQPGEFIARLYHSGFE